MYFPLFVGVLCLSLFCYALLITLCSFQICNHLEEEEKAGCFAIIDLQMYCYYVLWLFLTVPWVGLQCVIVVFPIIPLTFSQSFWSPSHVNETVLLSTQNSC